jgi:hypothetical protein
MNQVRPERVVLPMPPIGQDLRFRSFAEQLSVEEVTAEPAVADEVERSSGDSANPPLPWGARRDVGRAGGGAGLTPVLEDLGVAHGLLPSGATPGFCRYG